MDEVGDLIEVLKLIAVLGYDIDSFEHDLMRASPELLDELEKHLAVQNPNEDARTKMLSGGGIRMVQLERLRRAGQSVTPADPKPEQAATPADPKPDKLRRLLKNATPRPWCAVFKPAEREAGIEIYYIEEEFEDDPPLATVGDTGNASVNADLIVEAVNSLEELLNERDQLLERVNSLEKALRPALGERHSVDCTEARPCWVCDVRATLKQERK